MFRNITFTLFIVASCVYPAKAQEGGETFVEHSWSDLPKAAQDVSIPQDTGYLSREIAPGVFVVTEGVYQSMVVETAVGVVVVDAPLTIGTRLQEAIRKITNKPVTHFIYSHSHIDHVGAASQFDKVTRIASVETAEKLKRYSDPKRLLATQILKKTSQRLTIDGVEFQLDNHGNQHEPGNLAIFLPQKHVLMMVDIVYPGWVPFTNLGMAEEVQGFIDAHDTILEYDFKVFVGGHLSRPGNRRDVEIQREYVHDLIAAAKEGRQNIDFGKVAEEIGFANPWLLIKTYMDRVSDYCMKIMIKQWPSRLGGVAVSTPGHCWVMQEHLNINGLPRKYANEISSPKT